MHRLIFLFLLCSARAGAQQPPAFVPTGAQVVALGPGRKTAEGGIHRARLGQEIMLFAVLKGTRGAKTVVVTDAPAIKLGQRKVPSSSIVRHDEFPGVRLRWYKVEPTGNSYDNTLGGFHWEEIAYQEHPLGEFGSRWKIAADAHPVGYPDTHAGAGTMAFKVEILMGEKVFVSPGKESRYRGGLSDTITRVALRRDDTFLGRLTELFNTPYIWGSAGIPPEVHQAERLIGSDCADFIVYGARRLGMNLRYRGTWHLVEVTDTIATGERVDSQGRFLKEDSNPIGIGKGEVHPGDLLLFPRHVGALVEDRAPLGVLDGNDVMIHTYWAPPTEQPIKETAYADSPVRVLRWK